MKKQIISIAFHVTRIAVAMILGIISYIVTLVVFASLPIAPWTGKTMLPFVVTFAIAIACVVAVKALRFTKPPRTPSGPPSPWVDDNVGETTASSGSPR